MTEAGQRLAGPLFLPSPWPRGCAAFAVTAPEEAVPGPAYGQGAVAPALVGPSAAPPLGAPLSADKLIARNLGKAHRLWPKTALYGLAHGF